MSQITVLAKVYAKPGCEAALAQTMKAVIQPTHGESGCIKYDFHQALEDPKAFVMIEKWESQAVLDLHLKTPYIQDLFKKLPDLLAKPIEIQVLKSISNGRPEKLF